MSHRSIPCEHKWAGYFGTILRCRRCGALTNTSAAAGESKPIFTAHGKARTPSVTKLIHLLIEERAKFHALRRSMPAKSVSLCICESDRDQARAEIEAEVLR